MSQAFEDFARSVYGPITGRGQLEDYDLGSLARLKGDEIEAAEILLREILDDRKNDPRVARALEQIGSASAFSAMQKALSSYPNNATKVALAEVLWASKRYAPAVTALLEVLQNTRDSRLRAGAASALGAVPGARVDRALVAVMSGDRDATARQVAENALYERHGIADHLLRPPDDLEAAAVRLRSGDAAALDDFARIARRLRGA